jgi:hypothetical protein
VRRRVGRFPWIVAAEQHYSHGIHLNWLLPPIDGQSQLLAMWAHGRVSRPNKRAHYWLTPAERSRALVRYVSKDWNVAADQTPARAHRYRSARGFAPRPVIVEASTLAELHRILAEYFGERPARFWSSRDVPDWVGPATVVWQWR